MRFLTDIIRRTDKKAPAASVEAFPETAAPKPVKTQAHDAPVFSKMHRETKPDYTPPAGAVNSLNDLLDKWGTEQAEKPEVPPKPATKPATAAARRERVKTRLLGFEHADEANFDPFNAVPEAAPAVVAKTAAHMYPVGWLVVVEGPGRGASFTLSTGLSQIGRGEDQAVSLDYGDEAISRSNHAAVVYDPSTHSFLLGHGGKTNIVRLNNSPVISTETLSHGDTISMGETVLQLIVFSTPEQNWDISTDLDEGTHAASA